MSDEPVPRPMTNLINAANDGQVSVQMTPEEFIYLDRDCDTFKTTILQIQRLAEEVSIQDTWGLGEANDALISARAMVGRYKVKAKGAPDGNGVWEIMRQHYLIVEDIQNVYRTIRDRIMQADDEWAAAYNSLSASLPERPPVVVATGRPLPDGSTE